MEAYRENLIVIVEEYRENLIVIVEEYREDNLIVIVELDGAGDMEEDKMHVCKI